MQTKFVILSSMNEKMQIILSFGFFAWGKGSTYPSLGTFDFFFISSRSNMFCHIYLLCRYMLFWLVILSGKFSFAYFLQVSYVYCTVWQWCWFSFSFSEFPFCPHFCFWYKFPPFLKYYYYYHDFLVFSDKAVGEANKIYSRYGCYWVFLAWFCI